MKKRLFLLLAVIIIWSTVPAGAQVTVGIIGGPHFADLNVDIIDMDDDLALEFDQVTLYGLGGVIDLPLSPALTLRFEPMYLKRGGKLESMLPFELPNTCLLYDASYAEIPAMVKFEFGKTLRPYILAGPTVGILLDAKLTLEAMGLGINVDMKDVTKPVHFGLTYGMGISLPTSDFTLFFEWRYTTGLYDILEAGPVSFRFAGETIEETISDDDAEIKTKGFQMMAGLAIPLTARER